MIEHISLDGIIQMGADADGGFPYGDWSAPYRSPEGLAMVLGKWGERFDLLLGRRTYDLWAGFWPGAPKSPMAERLNAATKYVVTHRSDSLTWGPHRGVGPNLVEDVRRLKASDGPDLITSGSSTLTSTLLAHGLADEVLLLVSPVLLGRGKRLFADQTPAQTLALVSTKTSPTGVLINAYRYVGALAPK